MAHNKVAEDAVTRQRIRNIDKKRVLQKEYQDKPETQDLRGIKIKKNRSVRKAEKRRIHNRDGSTGC